MSLWSTDFRSLDFPDDFLDASGDLDLLETGDCEVIPLMLSRGCEFLYDYLSGLNDVLSDLGS